METFLYTLVQLVHNFGAAAVAGSPVAALWFGRENKIALQKITWLMTLGWVIQGATGVGFAITSYTMDGAIRHVDGIAFVALALKVACTFVGAVVAGSYLITGSHWSAPNQLRMWKLMVIMTLSALAAAAVLRWYS
jgi:hypothetical protein